MSKKGKFFIYLVAVLSLMMVSLYTVPVYAQLNTAKIEGVVRVSAGNYGGKLGKHQISLKELFP